MSKCLRCRYVTHLALPSHRRYPIGANSTPQRQRQPKAPDKSLPFLSSFIFSGAGHPPPLDAGLLQPPVARKHPPHLPSRPCRPPLRCCHNHHHLNTSTTGATSPTLLPYNQRHPTLSHRQGVQKVCLAPPFPRHPHLLTLPVCVGCLTRVAAPIVPPSLCAPPHPAPPRPAHCPLLHAGGRRR